MKGVTLCFVYHLMMLSFNILKALVLLLNTSGKASEKSFVEK